MEPKSFGSFDREKKMILLSIYLLNDIPLSILFFNFGLFLLCFIIALLHFRKFQRLILVNVKEDADNRMNVTAMNYLSHLNLTEIKFLTERSKN